VWACVSGDEALVIRHQGSMQTILSVSGRSRGADNRGKEARGRKSPPPRPSIERINEGRRRREWGKVLCLSPVEA